MPEPMRLLRLVPAAFVAASFVAAAQDAPAPYFLDDPAQWGRATLIVTPDYPKEALAGKVTGFVDVSGRINWRGAMEEIEYQPDKRESAVFARAVEQVIADWRFRNPLGNDCLPSATRVAARVWFELDGETPKISVTQQESEKRSAVPEYTPLQRVIPEYPWRMQRRGWQAVVFARIDIDAQGSVTQVTAKAFPREPRVDLSPFEDEAVEKLGQWKFPPLPAGRAPRAACYDMFFRLKG
jgi:outer membrane biosynthesis protein TonB